MRSSPLTKEQRGPREDDGSADEGWRVSDPLREVHQNSAPRGCVAF